MIEIALDAEDKHVFSYLLKILVSTIFDEYAPAVFYYAYSLGLEGNYWNGLESLWQLEVYDMIITYQAVFEPIAFRVAADGERAIGSKNEEDEYRRWLAIGFAAKLKAYIKNAAKKNKQLIFECFTNHSYEDADGYGMGAHDLLSGDDLIVGAELLEEYTNQLADSEGKCKNYLVAMYNLKTARNSKSLTSSGQRKIDKSMKRMCRKSWKYRSVVSEEYLEKTYNDIGLTYRPPNMKLKIIFGIICLIAFGFGLSDYSSSGVNDFSMGAMVISGFCFLFNIKPRFAFTVGATAVVVGLIYMAFLSLS